MQLQHLHLEYTDSTGQAGSIYYTQHAEDHEEDEDDNMPFSNLQHRFPNTDHMNDMCKFVSRCRCLKSLSLVGTQCLDLESLNWRPASSGLENVLLSRAVVTSATLLALLSSCNTLVSKTVALDMREVRLWDSTWGAIFDRLASTPPLRDIYVSDLHYDTYGESAGRRSGNGRLWEDSRVLWSDEENDGLSLRKLIERVEERGGRSGIETDGLPGGSDDEDEEE
jgi:hypothetical protein